MRANEVEAFDDELARLAERMIALMHDADGVGLAATQVGILRRLFVFHDEGEDRVVVNPVLTVDRQGDRGRRGGLPLARAGPDAGRARRRGDARRASTPTVTPVRLELEGISARVVQHELDHLDGTLIIDRTDPESRREALAQLRPRLVLTR